MLVEVKQTITSSEKIVQAREKTQIIRTRKVRIINLWQTAVWCCGSAIDGVSCRYDAVAQDQSYGIWTVGGYGEVGVRVCNQHQNILKLMSA